MKGVYFDGAHRKWRVEIKKKGKKYRFGDFDTLEAACSVARRAYEDLHGEFAKIA